MVIVLSAGQATAQLYREKSQVRRQLNQTQLHIQTVERQRQDLLKQSQDLKNKNTDVQKQLDQKVQEEQQLQQQVKDLQAAKAARQNQYVAFSQSVSAQAPVASSAVIAGCGDNSFAQYIYQHESGCRLNATNSGGCVGIGQACPGSKLYNVCPDLNYACQNAFFTDYANRAYGGWSGAYQFWLNNHWW